MAAVPTAPTTTITDRDVATALLIGVKEQAKLLTGAAMEASSPELRRLFERQLERRLKEQETVFDYMNKKKWYDPEDGPLGMARADLDYAERSIR